MLLHDDVERILGRGLGRTRVPANFDADPLRPVLLRKPVHRDGKEPGIVTDRVALITGMTGQDGARLAELLLGGAMWPTASSAVLPRSIRSASTTCMWTLMKRRRVSSFTTEI